METSKLQKWATGCVMLGFALASGLRLRAARPVKVSTGKVGKETRQGHSAEVPCRGWKHLEELIEGPGTQGGGLDVVLTCEAAPLSSLCPGHGVWHGGRRETAAQEQGLIRPTQDGNNSSKPQT